MGNTLRCINCGTYRDYLLDPDPCMCEGDFRAPWAEQKDQEIVEIKREERKLARRIENQRRNREGV